MIVLLSSACLHSEQAVWLYNLLNRKEEICGDAARLSIKYARCSKVSVLNISLFFIYGIQMWKNMKSHKSLQADELSTFAHWKNASEHHSRLRADFCRLQSCIFSKQRQVLMWFLGAREIHKLETRTADSLSRRLGIRLFLAHVQTHAAEKHYSMWRTHLYSGMKLSCTLISIYQFSGLEKERIYSCGFKGSVGDLLMHCWKKINLILFPP